MRDSLPPPKLSPILAGIITLIVLLGLYWLLFR